MVVALAVVVVSLGMLFYLQIVRFWCFLKRRNGPTDLRTDLWTDGRTDGRTDLRTDRPSYRDARTHLKTKILRLKMWDEDESPNIETKETIKESESKIYSMRCFPPNCVYKEKIVFMN